MSSLQKFHRRTNGAVPPTVGSEAPISGSGYWMGMHPVNNAKLILAPAAAEFHASNYAWGSEGSVRGTTSATDGISNTNTLYALGSAAHPAAYHCKTMTLGGYSNWYLPAIDELSACTWYNNTYTVRTNPFQADSGWYSGSTATSMLLSSTEIDAYYVKGCRMYDGFVYGTASYWGNYKNKSVGSYYGKMRAMRRIV